MEHNRIPQGYPMDFSGEYIRSIFRPNSIYGWEGSFIKNDRDEYSYQPGLRYFVPLQIEMVPVATNTNYRNLLVEEYLNIFVSNPEEFPKTVMLFRDQTQLGLTADILRNNWSNNLTF